MKFFSKINKRTLLLSATAILFVFIASFGMWIKSSNAIFHGFGGKSVYVMYCPCSANLAVFVLGVRGGVYSFGPGSLPFAWYQIFRSGPWVLGTFVPGTGMCLWPVPFGCAGFPTMGTILEVGTSI